jgi:hypothetical protein
LGDSFADAMHTSWAVIADITVHNENVMYEVGYAHGCGLTPLIYTRDATRLEQLPVYFRTLNVRLASPATPLDVFIDEYLRSLKATREAPTHVMSRAQPRQARRVYGEQKANMIRFRPWTKGANECWLSWPESSWPAT